MMEYMGMGVEREKGSEYMDIAVRMERRLLYLCTHRLKGIQTARD
jgi:hypothetical protein